MSTGLKANSDGSAAIQVGGTDYLTVTSGGNTTFTQAANLPNTFGFKNRIINGSMSIWQRATSATITAGSTIAAGYSTVDRFYVYCTGANVTAARVAGSGSTQYRMQITGAASVTAIGIGQRIEQANSYDMAGSTAMLSVDLANSVLTTVTWTAFYANTADTFGTLASPTRTQIATGTFTVTSTVTNYSTSISIPSAATTGIEIVFTVGAQTSGTWTIGNVQLEKGSTATSFDYRPYGTELALCQRYYFRITPGTDNPFMNPGYALNTSQCRFTSTFPVPLRVAPSSLEQSGTAADYRVIGGGVASTVCNAVPSFIAATTTGALVQFATAGGLTAYSGAIGYSNASASAYLGFPAEL